MTLGSIRERAFPRKPQPAAAPGPTQMLPIKSYREPAPPKPKTVGPNSRAEELITVIGPGQFRVRVPRDRDPRMDAWLGRDPFSLCEQMTLDRLMAETLSGDLIWPDGITAPVKRKTREELRAERLAVIRRVAESERDFRQMAFNEGFPDDTPWEAPSDEGRTTSTLTRRAREIRGLLRGRIFGR